MTTLKRLYILLGPDDYAQEKAIAALVAAMGDPQMATLNITKLEGSEVTPDVLLAATRTVPFLGDRRLVIVRGLLARFQPAARGRGSAPGTEVAEELPGAMDAAALPEGAGPGEGAAPDREPGANPPSFGPRPPSVALDAWRPFIESLPDLPDWTTLILADPITGERNRFFAALKPVLEKMKVKPEIFALPTGDRLRRAIEAEARAAGPGIEPAAAQLLATLRPDSPRLLANEVAKLAAYAGDRPVTVEDVRLLVADERETSVFELIDRLAEGRAGEALDTLQRLLDGGTAPLQILNLLARQYRILVQVLDLRARGEPPSRIQAAVGVHGYAWDKAWAQAQRHRLAELRAGYERLLAADRAIKTGEMDEDAAVETLVLELAEARLQEPPRKR